ncbi:hypothetical protein GCM10011309_15270 [Litorimonas cladophorae]|uniref:DoxX family protein n=2 Tax=Litorimonas cladophorae TaxID=1220491 RepID=A0A918NGS5_9PROT|nr:hypothetical protein GCM10011309_15270 [Litorimonas cladophorae]
MLAYVVGASKIGLIYRDRALERAMINGLKIGLVCFFALFFVLAGVMHFVKVDDFAAIVPPLLPFPKLIVWVTGLMEIAMGVMLLCPHFRANVGVVLGLFLLAVLPANIYMAMAGIGFDDAVASPAALWGRVAFQFPLIAVIYWCTRPRQDAV